MINEDLRDIIAEANEDAVLFDNPSFDNSIIGIDTNGRIIYSLELMIKELAEEDKISDEEAYEFIDYNTLRAIPYAGEYAPIVMDVSSIGYETVDTIKKLIDFVEGE